MHAGRRGEAWYVFGEATMWGWTEAKAGVRATRRGARKPEELLSVGCPAEIFMFFGGAFLCGSHAGSIRDEHSGRIARGYDCWAAL